MKGRSKSRARFVSSRALLYDAGQGLYRCGRRRFSKDPSNAASASSVRGREGPRHAQQSCSAVAAAHGAHLQVAPYTVNTPEGWQRMADAHVDAIITDDPAGLLAWLRAQRPPLHP